jgi:hypothetical protein
VIDATQETIMLKKISAALIAVSMLAAPAMAAGTAKTETAPVTKSVTPAAKPQTKSSLRNANAKMGRHHHRHYRHHRSHKKLSAAKFGKKLGTAKFGTKLSSTKLNKKVSSIRTGKTSKVAIKHVGSATKRS